MLDEGEVFGWPEELADWSTDDIDYALDGLLDADRLMKASGHSDEHFLDAWLLSLSVRAEAA